jgi:hypothetical protein
MTSVFRLSGLTAITLTAALSMTAGLAITADNNVSADQILNALQPKPVTRGLSAGPQVDPSVKAREVSFVETLRNDRSRLASASKSQRSHRPSRTSISISSLTTIRPRSARPRCLRRRNSARRFRTPA